MSGLIPIHIFQFLLVSTEDQSKPWLEEISSEKYRLGTKNWRFYITNVVVKCKNLIPN